MSKNSNKKMYKQLMSRLSNELHFGKGYKRVKDKKEYTLHVRVSKNEIINYKKLASEMGMNISTMTRFVLNKEIRIMENGKQKWKRVLT